MFDTIIENTFENELEKGLESLFDNTIEIAIENVLDNLIGQHLRHCIR
jgi:hypothetical protein